MSRADPRAPTAPKTGSRNDSDRLGVRFLPDERALLDRAATAVRMTPTALVRGSALAEADRIMGGGHSSMTVAGMAAMLDQLMQMAEAIYRDAADARAKLGNAA